MKKQKIVMVFGSFDILHPGHIMFLREAEKLGDRLIVVVARDNSIRKIKHFKPVLDEKARLGIIGSLSMVDKAVLGDRLVSKRKHDVIMRYKPDVLAFGYDQNFGMEELEQWLVQNKMRLKIVKIKLALKKNEFKSSKLKKRFHL